MSNKVKELSGENKAIKETQKNVQVRRNWKAHSELLPYFWFTVVNIIQVTCCVIIKELFQTEINEISVVTFDLKRELSVFLLKSAIDQSAKSSDFYKIP